MTTGEVIGGGEEQLLGKGEQLRSHLDELAGKNPPLDDFSLSMGRLLAARIEHGVVPMGYVVATELLKYDCGVTGVDGFTGQRMPRDVTDMPPVMYGIFSMEATQLARGAFGEEFASQVEETRRAIQGQGPETPASA